MSCWSAIGEARAVKLLSCIHPVAPSHLYHHATRASIFPFLVRMKVLRKSAARHAKVVLDSLPMGIPPGEGPSWTVERVRTPSRHRHRPVIGNIGLLALYRVDRMGRGRRKGTERMQRVCRFLACRRSQYSSPSVWDPQPGRLGGQRRDQMVWWPADHWLPGTCGEAIVKDCCYSRRCVRVLEGGSWPQETPDGVFAALRQHHQV